MADKISVVVISRNEGRELKRTVENLDDTLPAGGEIIVIDDGSKDGSADHLAGAFAITLGLQIRDRLPVRTLRILSSVSCCILGMLAAVQSVST